MIILNFYFFGEKEREQDKMISYCVAKKIFWLVPAYKIADFMKEIERQEFRLFKHGDSL